MAGPHKGKCEIDKDLDCAWQLIVDRLKELDRLDDYEEIAADQRLVNGAGRWPQKSGQGGCNDNENKNTQQTGKDS